MRSLYYHKTIKIGNTFFTAVKCCACPHNEKNRIDPDTVFQLEKRLELSTPSLRVKCSTD